MSVFMIILRYVGGVATYQLCSVSWVASPSYIFLKREIHFQVGSSTCRKHEMQQMVSNLSVRFCSWFKSLYNGKTLGTWSVP
jgi:hypothetical protein